MNRKLRERAGKMFVFRFYASVNSLIDGKMFGFNGILFVFIMNDILEDRKSVV